MSARITPTNPPPMTAPAMVPASSVVPFPMPWSGGAPGVAGCCPPGGDMSRLMQCYCDIQAAMQFISKIMIDLINNNPDVTAAIIAAIEKSGSALPLIGVTNGVAAQPGQVGEFIQLLGQFPYTAAASNFNVNVGILPPGDWDVWAFAGFSTFVSDAQFEIDPLPAGFVNNTSGIIAVSAGTLEAVNIVGNLTQALTSVPSLVNFNIIMNNSGTGQAGNGSIFFCARRAR